MGLYCNNREGFQVYVHVPGMKKKTNLIFEVGIKTPVNSREATCAEISHLKPKCVSC